jgi:sugar phosphate permease
MLMKDSPREHKWVSKEEADLIENTLQQEREAKGKEAGEKSTTKDTLNLLKNPYLWLVAIGYMTIFMIWWANMAWLPGYMVKERGMTVFKSGWMAAVPYLIGSVGMIAGGYVTDHLLKGKRMPYLLLCQLAGAPLVFLALGATSTAGMIALFSVSMYFTAGALAQFWPFVFDFFPGKVVGTAVGIVNFVGGFGGFFAPIIIGQVYDMTHSFYWGFGSIAIAVFLGALSTIPLLIRELKMHKAANIYTLQQKGTKA